MQSSISAKAIAPAIIVRRGLSQHPLVRFFANRNNAIAMLILGPIFFMAVFSSVLPLADPLRATPVDSLQGPSLAHPFGTDKLGRDVFARTVGGLRVSLVIGFSAATLSLTLGVLLGTLAGTLGKFTDTAISSLTGVLLAFPGLLLAIGIISVFGSGSIQLIFALGLSSMPAAIRLQRSLALGLRSRTFMDAARMANAPTWWLVLRHVVPNTVAPMVVVATIYAANAILAEASLSFLGLGITPPQPSLGNLVSDGRNYLREAWWISTLPGLAIVVVAISLHLFSDGIREQLDPALRK